MENKRSGFLTTLCILTFIGSGFGLIGSVLSIVGSSALSFLTGGLLGLPAELMMWLGVGNLLAAALCLYGAISMWKLKMLGYWLYLGGSVVSLIVSVITKLQTDKFLAVFSPELAGASSWGSVIFSFVIIGAFVGMYSVNKKHLS
jgi:hypothetical protein